MDMDYNFRIHFLPSKVHTVKSTLLFIGSAMRINSSSMREYSSEPNDFTKQDIHSISRSDVFGSSGGMCMEQDCHCVYSAYVDR